MNFLHRKYPTRNVKYNRYFIWNRNTNGFASWLSLSSSASEVVDLIDRSIIFRRLISISISSPPRRSFFSFSSFWEKSRNRIIRSLVSSKVDLIIDSVLDQHQWDILFCFVSNYTRILNWWIEDSSPVNIFSSYRPEKAMHQLHHHWPRGSTSIDGQDFCTELSDFHFASPWYRCWNKPLKVYSLTQSAMRHLTRSFIHFSVCQ